MMVDSQNINLAGLYAEKICAELEEVEREFSEWNFCASNGNVFAMVLLVKGQAGPAEQCGGPALSGPDGEAAAKALSALGFAANSEYRTMSRPLGDNAPSTVVHSRLMWQIQIIDPPVIIALDGYAAADVAGALDVAPLSAGVPVETYGRTILALQGLEDSLCDERLKRIVWEQLKQLPCHRRSG